MGLEGAGSNLPYRRVLLCFLVQREGHALLVQGHCQRETTDARTYEWDY